MRVGLLAVLGAASGLSAIAEGFYNVTTWGPIAIGVLALALGLVTGAARPRLLPALAVGGITFLWLWSWVSAAWAESTDQAIDYAGRWALYAAVLLAMLLLMRRYSERFVPLAFAAAGVVAVGLYVVISMAYGDGADFFFGGRLRDPLGYVNGQAGYFLLGFWPCVAVAEQSRRKLLAGLGAAGALVVASLLMLSQTRGVIPGLAVSAVVVLLVVPGRARRIWVLAAVGVALAAIAGPLLDVYQERPPELGADPRVVEEGARLILPAAALLGVGWAAITWFLGGVAGAAEPPLRRGLVLAERALAVVVLVVAIGGLVAATGSPTKRVSDQYDNFVNLRVNRSSDTRFLSGGGYRYDYWRIAWLEFKEKPLNGFGAGNFDARYFAERRTSEDIRQPHSLPMQLLGELGILGLLALVLFVGAVFTGLWRTARRGRTSPTRRMLAVGAGGAFSAWLMHTSVDWLHVLPGVTAIALCAAAGLLAPWSRRPAGRALATGRILAVIITAVAVFAAADLVGRMAAADHYRLEGRGQLNSDPVEALRLANRALDFNSQSVPALYIKSAAYARLGRYSSARNTMRQAARLEPSNPQPWMLLGDLAVRRGDLKAARRAYRRAARLDPKNVTVKRLAEDPRRALPQK